MRRCVQSSRIRAIHCHDIPSSLCWIVPAKLKIQIHRISQKGKGGIHATSPSLFLGCLYFLSEWVWQKKMHFPRREGSRASVRHKSIGRNHRSVRGPAYCNSRGGRLTRRGTEEKEDISNHHQRFSRDRLSRFWSHLWQSAMRTCNTTATVKGWRLESVGRLNGSRQAS